MKIIIIIATICHTSRLNAPSSISAGAPPQALHAGQLTAFPQTSKLDLRVAASKEIKRRGRERKKGI